MNTSSTQPTTPNQEHPIAPIPQQPQEPDNILTMQPSLTRTPRPHPAGKVARLPAEIREQINKWIEDNVSYAEIITRLESQGHHGINRQNVSNWANSGYEIWLRKREALDVIRLQSEANGEIIRELDSNDPMACTRLNQRFLAVQFAQLGQGLDLNSLRCRIEADPNAFFRLARSINAQTRNVYREQKLQMQLNRQTEQELRDLGIVRPTTSQAGYDAIAAEFGLPPRFSVPLPPFPKTVDQNANEQPDRQGS